MKQIAANVHSIEEARKALAVINQRLVPTDWMAYSASWTGTGSNPAIGNGSLLSYYWRNSEQCYAAINLTCGGTTTFGTGGWAFSLPTDMIAGVDVIGQLLAFDSATGVYYSGAAIIASASPTEILPYAAQYWDFAAAHGTGGRLTSALPFGWGSGDTLKLAILYPCEG